MADQNQILIGLVYGADHSLSLDSQEYELAEEIRKDEREQIAAWYEAEGQMIFPVAIPKIIRARGAT